MRYGAVEFAYAEPFANALVEDSSFRAWVLRQTKFSEAEGADILHEEMMAQRNATTYWRSHFTEKCRCQGCSGQETDIFAVFEGATGIRFALHFEVKQPRDKFPANKDQAANYAFRAKCWVDNLPQAVLAHDDAATVLLCSASKLREYARHLPKFGSIITFEEVNKNFPNLYCRLFQSTDTLDGETAQPGTDANKQESVV
jgi:hypothetical protein